MVDCHVSFIFRMSPLNMNPALIQVIYGGAKNELSRLHGKLTRESSSSLHNGLTSVHSNLSLESPIISAIHTHKLQKIIWALERQIEMKILILTLDS